MLTQVSEPAAWPAMEETAGEFGKRMNSMPKVVASTTLTEATWNNTTARSGSPGLAHRPGPVGESPDLIGDHGPHRLREIVSHPWEDDEPGAVDRRSSEAEDVMLRTRVGWRSAMRWTSWPPIDVPNRCAESQPRASRTATASSVMSSAV